MPVVLWGFQRGCERMPDLDRQVEKELFNQHGDVGLLSAPGGKPLQACAGETCGQELRTACPDLQARVLGGQVETGRGTVRTRLWLYDTATGQIAYQDDYCQSCGLLGAVTAHARRLIDKPSFGSAPGRQPAYCAAAAPPGGTDSQVGPVFLTVFGDGKHRPQLYEALKQQIGLRGRQVLPVASESRSYGLEELRTLVAGQRGAQVLGVNVPKDGKVQVFLFDQRTERTNAKAVSCADCGQDKDVLIARVQPEVAAILEYCFGLHCADPGARPAGVQPPPDACEPFAEAACASAPLSLASTSSSSGPSIDPRTAKIALGLTWGTFAATAATAVTLGIANSFVTQEQNGHAYGQTLTAPAWTAGGISVGILAAAIPLTLTIHRAKAAASSKPASSPSTIQCPN